MAGDGQKTEPATPRRLEKARRQGQFIISREAVAGLQFAVFAALAASYAPACLEGGRRLVRALLVRGFQGELDRDALVSFSRQAGWWVLAPLAAAGGLLLVVTLAGQLAVTRLGIAAAKLAPDLRRLDPWQRLKSLPRQNLPQFLQAALLLPLFLFAVWAVFAENLAAFLRLPLAGLESGVARVAESMRELMWKAAAIFLLIGAVDYLRQMRRYQRDLRMSRQDIRDEMKEVEGSPHTRMRIRRMQRDLLRRRMMSQVPKATAVVVNPTHYAVALLYEPGLMPAPKVVAKGRNFLALRIREKAVRHHVPVVENAPLAQALYKSAEVGQEIPPQLYRAVAEVLAYIYRLRRGRGAARPA